MSESGNGTVTEIRGKDGRFAPGCPRPPRSGSRKGQISAALRARKLIISHFHGVDADGDVRGLAALDRLYEKSPRDYLRLVAMYIPRPEGDRAPAQIGGATINVGQLIAMIDQVQRGRSPGGLIDAAPSPADASPDAPTASASDGQSDL